MTAIALTITGSDSRGGADLKTCPGAPRAPRQRPHRHDARLALHSGRGTEGEEGMTAVALSIAGPDSEGAAGIQAGLQTFSAPGMSGTSIVTAATRGLRRAVDTAWKEKKA